MKSFKQDPPATSDQDSDHKPRRRASFLSMRSTRSIRSAKSAKSGVSHASKKSRKSNVAKRPRGLSFSSMRSQAVSLRSQRSRSGVEHADDSDASDTDESLGETDEDVWFPNQHEGSGDINVDELDELLNFSDDNFAGGPHDGNQFHRQTSFAIPSMHVSPNTTNDHDHPNTEEENSEQKQETESSSSNEKNPEDIELELPTSVPPTPSMVPRNGTGGPHMERLTLADQLSQRYSFYAANMESTVHAPDLASLAARTGTFSSLFKPENGVWFLDCFRPKDSEMRAICRAFGIHPLTSEDILTQDMREKYEGFKNYYFIAYHTFDDDPEDETYLEQVKMYFLVFNEGVISFHFEPVAHCRNVRRRMRQLKDYLTLTSDWIAYALIDDITDSFAPQIRMIEEEADFVEDAVYIDTKAVEMETLLKRLGEARKCTMQLMRMLSGKADVIRGFAKRCQESKKSVSNEMSLYLGDIQDHVLTMYQNLSAYEKIFSRSHFNYMGLLQMEFVNSSNRMTDVLGKVTIIGTIMVPMNLITGLFGMNVKVPGQDGSNLGWWFGILGVVLLSIVVLLLGSIIYLKRSVYKDMRTV